MELEADGFKSPISSPPPIRRTTRGSSMDRLDEVSTIAALAKALLERNEMLNIEIEQLKQEVNAFDPLKQRYQELDSENAKLKSRNMFLENQLRDASSTNDALLSEVEHKERLLSRSIKENKALTALRDKERTILDLQEQIEGLKQRISKADAMEENYRKNMIKLLNENESLVSQSDALQHELEALQADYAQVETWKQNAKSIEEKNKRLESMFAKMKTQLFMQRKEPFTEHTLLQQIIRLLSNPKFISKTQENEILLVDKATCLLKEFESDASKGQLFSKLSGRLKLDLSQQRDLNQSFEDDDELEFSLIPFLFVLFSLLKQESLEKSVAQARAAHKELQEDLSEITEKYQLEQKGKIKLEEKLEASLVAAEETMNEKLELLKQELETSFEQQKTKLEKEIKILKESEKTLKEKLALEIDKSLAVQQDTNTVLSEDNKRLSEARSQIDKLEKELEEKKHEFETETGRLTLQIDEIKKLLETEKLKLKNSQEQNAKEKIAWEKVTDELRSLVKQANKERDEISKENLEHLEQSKEHLEKLKIRETELELLKAEYDRRLSDILSKSKAEEFEKLKVQYDALKVESDNIQKLLEDEKRKIKIYESHNRDLQSSNRQQADEIIKKDREISELKISLESETKAKIALEHQLEALRNEISEMKKRSTDHPLRTPEKIMESLVEKPTENPLEFSFEDSLGDKTLNEEEKMFLDFVNDALKNDLQISSRLPIGHRWIDVANATLDGTILCKLINYAVPGTIDERVIKLKPKTREEMAENHNLLINSAYGIGIAVNLQSKDFLGGKSPRIMAFIAEIVEVALLSRVSMQIHPELRVLITVETLDEFKSLSSEQILIKWFNYHLQPVKRSVRNFSTDIQDSINYTHLLYKLAPEKCNNLALQERDIQKRANLVVQNARAIDVSKFITPDYIITANPKMNLLFVANLFHLRSGLEVTETHRQSFSGSLISDDGTREERAFRLWINSLGISVKNLSEDVRDGIVILKVLDKISPGIVNWTKISLKPSNNFQKIENCTQGIQLAGKLNMNLINMGGKDFYEGNRKLILGFIWQAMKCHILTILGNLEMEDGREVQEEIDMLAWANARVAAAGKKSSTTSFKDPSLSDSRFFLDLIDTIKPGAVDYSLLSNETTYEAKKLNANYAISVARKIGCCIFFLWEDIVEVQPKMMITFVGSLMSIACKPKQPGMRTERPDKSKRLSMSFSRRNDVKAFIDEAKKEAQAQTTAQLEREKSRRSLSFLGRSPSMEKVAENLRASRDRSATISNLQDFKKTEDQESESKDTSQFSSLKNSSGSNDSGTDDSPSADEKKKKRSKLEKIKAAFKKG